MADAQHGTHQYNRSASSRNRAGVLMLNMRDNRGGSRAVAITKDLGKTGQNILPLGSLAGTCMYG